MNFVAAKAGMAVFEKYESDVVMCSFAFEHDACWVLFLGGRTPDLSLDEVAALEDAGWFLDDEDGIAAWCHF